jgi:hypothetical protein
MDDQHDIEREAPKGKRGPRDHLGRFKRLDAPRNAVDRAIRLIAPDDRPETLMALFDNRVGYHTIRSWRRRGHAAQWAVDLLRAKDAARSAVLNEMTVGPGKQVGRRNMASYQATRFLKNKTPA